jgi:hypothetical protein
MPQTLLQDGHGGPEKGGCPLSIGTIYIPRPHHIGYGTSDS